MSKNYRQGQILKLIRTRKVSTQEELSRELKSLGVDATQVTLSRDIREMGLVKTTDGYKELQPEVTGPSLEQVLGEFLFDVRLAMNLVVMKTSAGNANTLAVKLDQEDWPEITGTVAGDDTILVICWDEQRAKAVRDKLLKFIEN